MQVIDTLVDVRTLVECTISNQEMRRKTRIALDHIKIKHAVMRKAEGKWMEGFVDQPHWREN